jgi:hypothetical protein
MINEIKEDMNKHRKEFQENTEENAENEIGS